MPKTLTQISVARRNQLLKRTQHKAPSNKRVLSPKKGKHSEKPVYLSGTYTEYKIKQDDFGRYYIIKHGGGKVPSALRGLWTNHQDCEKVLIAWLEDTDKRQQSRYPGCPERKETNYTRTFK